MNDMHGIIFAYSSDQRMKELTEHRTVSSIPFGARYRVIDFVLSSMVNAGISDIGVIMHENYQSLLDHLGPGKDWDLDRKRGGLRILPPFGLTTTGGRNTSYRGRMEALGSVLSYIKQSVRQKYIVMADGDIIANIDLEAVLEKHLTSGADITAVYSKNLGEDPAESTYFKFDGDGMVCDVVTSPDEPQGNSSLGVYLISKSLLLELIADCVSHSLFSFDRDVLQKRHGELKIAGYEQTGFAVRMQSTVSYFRQSMKLLEKGVRSDLFIPERPIKTKVRDEASTYYAPGSKAVNCIAADGCYIDGEIKNCVLFRGVRIGKGAKVSNSILMQDTVVEDGVTLDYVVTDKDVVIKEGRTLVGYESYPITISKGSIV